MMEEMGFYFQSDKKPMQQHEGLTQTFKRNVCVINLEDYKRQHHMHF